MKSELIAFLMAGYPSLEQSEAVAVTLIHAGVTTLEIGVPFSDPMADGPLIQKAHDQALKQGVTLAKTLHLAEKLATRFPQVRLVIFSYFNPLLKHGLGRYVEAARKAGVYATLAVDLPVEESFEYREAHRLGDLKTVFLASPTTSAERFKKINEASTGFIYYVSRTGVTGVQDEISPTLGEEIKRLRSLADKPLAVGFGISTGDQARVIADYADAVVVGSAFIKRIEENPGSYHEKIHQLAVDLLDGLEPRH